MALERDIVVERRVSASPEKVFTYFTDADKWTAWQGVEAEVELEPRGLWRVNVTGDGFASGRVLEGGRTDDEGCDARANSKDLMRLKRILERDSARD